MGGGKSRLRPHLVPSPPPPTPPHPHPPPPNYFLILGWESRKEHGLWKVRGCIHLKVDGYFVPGRQKKNEQNWTTWRGAEFYNWAVLEHNTYYIRPKRILLRKSEFKKKWIQQCVEVLTKTIREKGHSVKKNIRREDVP